MEKIIQFREWSDSLNDEEYQICINKFLTKCTNMTFDRNSVVSIIFNGFCNELKDDNMDNINTMNKIIKKILKKREKKSDESEDDVDMEQEEKVEIKKIKLDELPQDLFVGIVSYLEFIERTQFEKTNRSIFLNVRSSNHISVHHFPDDICAKFLSFYKDTDINDYDQLHIFKSLTMTAEDFFEYDPDNFGDWRCSHFILMERIDSFTIYFALYEHLLYILSELETISYWKNLCNMKTLRIIGGDVDDIYSGTFALLKKIFTPKATAAEYFEIAAFFNDDGTVAAYDVEWISKLKGIAIYDYENIVNLNDHIYSAMGHNVESLHHDWLITDNINGKMKELKEFCTSWCLKEKEIDILMKQNMNNLQRIYFKNSQYSLRSFTGDLAKNLVLFFENILKTAEYIGFNLNDSGYNENLRCPTFDLFHTLNKALKNKKKKKLKIRIDEMGTIPFEDSNDIYDMIGNVKELIRILNRNICHWMVIISDLQIPANKKLSFDPLELKEQYTLHLNDKAIKWEELNVLDTNKLMNNFLSSMSMEYNVKYNKNKNKKKKQYNVVISNQQCEISGYHEHWIMECSRCTQPTLFD